MSTNTLSARIPEAHRPMRRHQWLFIALLTCLMLCTSGMALGATADMRLLIDVSGSMRQNDPNNLRVPALRLVNELLPGGARAGIWTFAEDVETLVEPALVDEAWKTRARNALGRIHSRGQLTDIERALDAASADWSAPDPEHERHIVLLTDGLVDVSKNAAEDTASRARIAGEQVERLKDLDAKVHVIALSDSVDTELMQILSERTGGWMETPRDADTLQRVFLHMLEQSAAPATLPLDGNRFSVDDQVSEFTVLAFREAQGTTRLVSPTNRLISAADPGEGVQWRAESAYDLVTVSEPAAGEWELLGAEDPDNRVAIITDLGIRAAAVPGSLYSGDTLNLEVWLTSDGQPVVRADLLQLLTGRAQLTPVDHDANALALELALDADTQRFTGAIKANALTPGLYELNLVLDGTTFQRQMQKRVRVVKAPVSVTYDAQPPASDGGTARLRIIINAEPEQIDPDSLFGYVRIQRPDENLTLVELGPLRELPMLYEVAVDLAGTYAVNTRLAVRTRTGRSIMLEPLPERFQFNIAPPENAQEQPDAPDPGAFSWLELTLYVLGSNAVLGLLMGLIWWLRGPHRRPRPHMDTGDKQ